MSTHHSETALPAVEGRSTIDVLLVDDQRFVGMAVARLLASEQDIALHCCHAAADALAQGTLIAPDIILQDLALSDLDGLILVGMFRANPVTAATPIVVLSGNDDASTRAQALAAGANDFLVKLPGKDALVACIRRHVPQPPGQALGAAFQVEHAGELQASQSLDPEVIASLREAGAAEDAEFLALLIDEFVREATSLVSKLSGAQPGDVAALKAAAHSLKGSSMTMGARRLAGLCTELENQLEHDPGVLVGPLVKALGEELVEVRLACARERSGPHPVAVAERNASSTDRP